VVIEPTLCYKRANSEIGGECRDSVMLATCAARRGAPDSETHVAAIRNESGSIR